MITFRKKTVVQDLMSDAVEYLKKQKVIFNTITEDRADEVSKVNSKAMVLMSFMRNDHGCYEIKLKDKELYNYTQKLVKDYFGLTITDIDKNTKTITAECEYEGRVLDLIEVLGEKYNLSIVQ